MSGSSKSQSTPVLQIAGVVALVLAMWLVGILMPIPEGRKPLTVAVGMWPASETLIVARNAGELPRDAVNLVEINWASAAMRAVGNRVVDVTYLSLDEVVRQMAQGYPLRIVLVTDISRGADAVVTRRDLTEARQLAGLRVGYEPRTAASVILDRYLREGGLTWDQVEEVPVNPAEAEEAFQELMLDALVLSEPWIQRLKRLNLRTIYDSAGPGGEVVRVLAVHDSALKSRPQEVEALVRAHLKWMPRLAGLQAELEPILRREGVNRGEFLEILKKLEAPTLEQNVQWLTGKDPWLLSRMESLAKQLQVVQPGQRAHFEKALVPTFVTQKP